MVFPPSHLLPPRRSSYSFLFTRFYLLFAFHTGKFSCLVFCETVFFDGVADLLHHFIIKIQIMQGT